MNQLLQAVRISPLWVRVLPFLVFVLLTFLQGKFGEASRYWIYFLKTLVGAWMIWLVWAWIPEMRWKISWEAVAAGVLVLVIWVGLDTFYPKLGAPGTPWNPHQQFGAGSSLAWFFVIARILGSALVVPLLEEVVYRSFLYRYLIQPEFVTVSFKHFDWKAFLFTAIVFGFAHFEWLAGILCAFVYQGLVLRKGRLGDAITAHAITNFLLGVYIVWKGAWHFW